MADMEPSPPPGRPRALRPRAAASLIVYEPQGDGTVKILVGRRRADQVFLPGYYVFPGGRLDRQDRRLAAGVPLSGELGALSVPETGEASDRAALAHILAAVRETFEETGYLVGPEPRDLAQIDDLKQGRWPANARATVSEGLLHVAYVCRATTPPGRPRRYDTRFFAVPRYVVTGPYFAGDGELEQVGFQPLRDLWGLQLPSITRLVLADFEAFVPDLLNGAKTPKDGVPFYFQRGTTGQRVLMSRRPVLP